MTLFHDLTKIEEYTYNKLQRPNDEHHLDFTDVEWEALLKWLLFSDNLLAVTYVLKSPEWKVWSTSPDRITDCDDGDLVPGVGLSRVWLIINSRFAPIGYWHDLMCRKNTAKYYSKTTVDMRFKELCFIPEFYIDWFGKLQANIFSSLVAFWPNSKFGSP